MTKTDEKQRFVKFTKAAEELNDSLDKRAIDVALIESLQDAQEAFQREAVTKKQISADTNARWRYALRCLDGIDKVDKVFAVLANDTTPQFIRAECLYCLSLWLASGRDNDYQMLEILRKEYPKQASIKIMELLHGISPEDARKPITYQTLIENLNNELLPIRFLSSTHLYGLAPVGNGVIPYDVTMSRPEREASIQAWRKMIPPGQLPPMPKAK